VDRHKAVAGDDAHQRRQPAHQQRLIDIAGLEVAAIGDVIQLIPKVPIVAGDEHMGNKRHASEYHQESGSGPLRDGHCPARRGCLGVMGSAYSARFILRFSGDGAY
jgi:hypothetical protein